MIKTIISKQFCDFERSQYKLHDQIWRKVGLHVHSNTHSIILNIKERLVGPQKWRQGRSYRPRQATWHPTFELFNCEVCQKLTTDATGLPFGPGSIWRCVECKMNKRLTYEYILVWLSNSKSYDDAVKNFVKWWESGVEYKNGVKVEIRGGKEFFESYLIPTLKFFNKTTQEAWEDANPVYLNNRAIRK